MSFETMKNVLAGDTIVIEGLEGQVVFCSISDSYAEDFPQSDWPKKEYDGVMIRMANGALVFHDVDVLQSDDCTIELRQGNCALPRLEGET